MFQEYRGRNYPIITEHGLDSRAGSSQKSEDRVGGRPCAVLASPPRADSVVSWSTLCGPPRVVEETNEEAEEEGEEDFLLDDDEAHTFLDMDLSRNGNIRVRIQVGMDSYNGIVFDIDTRYT
ncbi:hypothetical protein V1478_009826, partial [Vespula squamosa]